MTYYYYVSYDENKDQFFAMVDDGKTNSIPIFCINDTEEMVDYIKTGVMTHIDDVDGLFNHMSRMDIVNADDDLTVVEKALV